MDYNFNGLNTTVFEELIQSLTRKILGNGQITFGAGADGGREATFQGKAPFPSQKENWEGYWIIQAKFKARDFAKEDNFSWLKSQFQKEVKKLKKININNPENYLLFTNVILTPQSDKGGRDKIEEYIKDVKKETGIKNIQIFGYDDLCGFIDNNRDVATSYACFITPGDILMALFSKLDSPNKSDLLARFIESEFMDDSHSRLDHAGKLTSDKVNIEKVFVDLHATNDGIRPLDNALKFISTCINTGNSVLRNNSNLIKRYVLIGGPGYGKSTLTQYLSQIYRAYFLSKLDECSTIHPDINEFIDKNNQTIKEAPSCFRVPLRIILKDFASWVLKQKELDDNCSVLTYLKIRIAKKANGEISEDELRILFKNLSFVIVFDGLDEVPHSQNRQDVLDEINKFIDIELRRINVDALIIATTRPQGYTKEFDENQFHHLKITDLNKDDCLQYLEKLLLNLESNEEKREKHIELLNKALNNNITARLMRTPLEASFMSILVMSGGEPPKNKYELFTSYYETIFKRESQKNVTPILNEQPEYIREIHSILGFKLQYSSENSSNPSSTVDVDEFEEIINTYLKDIHLTVNDANILSNQIKEAAIERLVFISEVEDHKIGFSIRSFQEFFASNNFISNIPDGTVSKRLRDIAQNSYWRNTFIFCLGYINKHKKYLIDTVESICNELNGSANDYKETTLSSQTKIGSWLALDILNEGVFRGQPKYENKFVHLVVELYDLHPSEKHADFGRLSSEIVNSSITSSLTDKLSCNVSIEEKFSAFTIAIFIIKNGNTKLKEILSKCWPRSEKEIIKLWKYILTLNIDQDEFILLELTKALKKIKVPINSIKLFENKKNLLLSLSELAVSLNDYKIKRILIQYSFINWALEDNILFRSFNRLINEDGSNTSYQLLDNHVVEIVEDYYLVFNTTSKDSKGYKRLAKVFKDFNINYLNFFIGFLQKPSNNLLIKFFKEIKKDKIDIEIIKYYFTHMNWILDKVLDDSKSINEIIEKCEQGLFGDSDEWGKFEIELVTNGFNNIGFGSLSYLTYRRRKNYSTITMTDFVDKIYGKKIQDKNEELTIKKEFIWLIYWFSRDNSNLRNKLLKDKEVLRKLSLAIGSIKDKINNHLYFDFVRMYLLEILETEELFIVITEHKDKFKTEIKSYLELEYLNISETDFEEILRKICFVFRNILNKNLDISIALRVLTNVVFQLDSNILSGHLSKFSYEELYTIKVINDEDIRAKIILLSLKIENEKDFDNIIKLYSPSKINKNFLTDIMVSLDKNLSIKGVLNQIYLKINNFIDPNDYEAIQYYQKRVKDFVESEPANISMELS